MTKDYFLQYFIYIMPNSLQNIFVKSMYLIIILYSLMLIMINVSCILRYRYVEFKICESLTALPWSYCTCLAHSLSHLVPTIIFADPSGAIWCWYCKKKESLKASNWYWWYSYVFNISVEIQCLYLELLDELHQKPCHTVWNPLLWLYTSCALWAASDWLPS